MLQHTSTKIRRTALCVATALAMSLPGIAMAGPKAKSPAPKPVVHLGNVVAKAGKKVAKAARKGPAPLPGAELIRLAQELNLMDQLQNTIALMQQMNADYEYFAGGATGCKAECKAFRKELKDTFDDFLDLVEEVPVLSAKPGLFETIERVADLIDVVPPRALYLMWQALDAQMDELRMTADRIRDLLDALPPLEPVSNIGAYANQIGTGVAGSPICEWVDDPDLEPFVELVQAELEHIGWIFTTVEGYIPDVEIKVEGGGEAGAAVANVTGAAGIGAKPTDAVKSTLKVIVTITKTVNWAIKLNVLRAKVVCDVAEFAAK